MTKKQYEPGEIVEYNGDKVRVMKNGAGYSLTKKHITVAPGTFREDHHRITSATASNMAKRRYSLAKQRVRQRIYEQAKQGIFPDARGPTDAYAMSVAGIWADATDKQEPLRDRAAVLKFVGEAGGWRETRNQAGSISAEQAVVVMGDKQADRVLELLRGRQDGD